MNLFKIVQKRTDKSNIKSSPFRDAHAVLLFVFLLPYVIACLWGNVGEETERISTYADKGESDWIDEKYEIALSGSWGIRKMSLQEYLIRKLEIVMGGGEDEGIEYEIEALKAQAVLLRTELWELFLSTDDTVTIQDDVTIYETKYAGGGISDEEKTLYEQAVCETDGIYLSYDGLPIKAAFFPVSNGKTRDASQSWSNVSYPYLVSVECNKDIMSGDYQSQVTVSKEKYNEIIEEIYREAERVSSEANNEVGEDKDSDKAGNEQNDNENGSNGYEQNDNKWDDIEFTYDSAGYVLWAERDGYSCSGEVFRNAFGLNSASFQMEFNDKEVIFHVKGMGHGFGMSQYGANERAASGEKFEQILKYYFFQTELAKIE